MSEKEVELLPLDMSLWCPRCFEQHIDTPLPGVCQDCGHDQDEHGFETGCGTHKMNCPCEKFVAWLNPPHKSHRCNFCNYVWRPADGYTNGVLALKTTKETDGSSKPVAFASGKDFDDAVKIASDTLTARVAELEAGLRKLIVLAEGLYEQQAMSDDTDKTVLQHARWLIEAVEAATGEQDGK